MTDFILKPCVRCSAIHAEDDCPLLKGGTRVEVIGDRRAAPPRRSAFHDALPACVVCRAPAGASCIDATGKTMPGTAVHRCRITPNVRT